MRALPLLLLLLALPGPGFAADQPQGEPGPWVRGLAEQLDAIRQRHEVAAAAAIVVDRERIQLAWYAGVHDREGNQPVTAQSYFRVGSVTKAFTGLALLAAQREGLVDMNRPARRWLPKDAPDEDFAPVLDNPYLPDWPISLAMLMEHTAGFHDMSPAEFDIARPMGIEQAMAVNPASRRAHWPPGWHSSYSNTGPGVVAWALERASGQPFAEFIQARVFEPLGMGSATLLLTEEVEQGLVRGYDRDGRTPIPYWHIVYPAAGAMNLRPADMAPFLWLLLDASPGLPAPAFSPEESRRLRSAQTTLAAGAGLEFGYGLGVYQTLHQGHVLEVHGGDADGYLAHFAASRESGRAYFVVINAFNHRPLGQMKAVLNDALVTGLPQPRMPAVADDPEASGWVGTYRRASSRFARPGWQREQLRIRLMDGVLQTRQGDGRWRELLAVAPGLYRRPDEPLATAALLQDPDGRAVLQGRMGNWVRVTEGD